METSSKDADLGQIQDFSISAHDVLTAFPLGIWLVAAVLAILSLAVVYFVHLTLAVGIFFIAIFDLFMFILVRPRSPVILQPNRLRCLPQKVFR